MGIRAKLLAFIGPTLLALILIGVLTFTSFQNIVISAETVETHLYVHDQIDHIQVAIQQSVTAPIGYLISGDVLERSRFAPISQDIGSQLETIETYLQPYGEEHALLSDARAQWVDLLRIAQEILRLERPVGNAQGAILLHQLTSTSDELISTFQTLHNNYEVQVGAVRGTSDQALLRAVLLIAPVILLSLVWGIISSWRYSSSLIRPLNSLTRTAESLGRGELSARAVANSKDELELLARTMNFMAEALEDHWDRLRQLRRGTHAITAGTDLEDSLGKICILAKDLLAADRSAFFLLAHNNGHVISSSSLGLSSGFIERTRGEFHQLPCGRALKESVQVTSPVAEAQPILASSIKDVVQEGYKSSAVLPLTLDKETVGALALYWDRPYGFDENVLRLAQLLADQAAIAVERSHQRQSVKLAEDRYKSLADGVPVGLYRSTFGGEILEANPALVKMLGYPSERALRQAGAIQLYPDQEDRERWISLLTKEGTVHDFEARLQRKDGKFIWIRNNASVIYDPDGQPIYFEGMLQDVTERKRAGEEVRRLLRAIEQSASMVLITTASGLTEYVNPKVEEVTGFSADELLGKNPRFLMSGKEAAETFEDLWASITSGKEWRGILQTRKKNDECYWASASVSPVVDDAGKITHFLAVIDDITERKRAEEQIQRHANRLDALRAIDVAISATLDPRVSLNVLLNRVTKELGVDSADVLWLNPHTQLLEFAAGTGFRTNALEKTHLRVGKGHAGRAALEQTVVNIPDLCEDWGEFHRAPLLRAEEFVSYFAVPLVAKGQVKGVLELFHRSLLTPGREWHEFLESLAAQAAIAIDNATLFEELQRSNLELRLAYDNTLEGWARALELRDRQTEGHTRRVAQMTLRLVRKVGINGNEVEHINRGAVLHDIGKMAVPDSILLKSGPLNDHEWEIMRRHPVYALEMLSPIDYLEPALDIPYCHHERWDGTGYPRGLKTESIPLPARIFAVVDVWDALLSDRPYRRAWDEAAALEYIRSQAGTHFDPDVIACFFDLLNEMGDARDILVRSALDRPYPQLPLVVPSLGQMQYRP